MTYAKTAFASVASAAALLLASSSAHAAVVINEVLRNGATAAGDFVELYNNGDEAVDISGWVVRSGTNPNLLAANGGLRATIPASTTLEPGSYWLITRAEADAGPPASGQDTLAGTLPAGSSNVDSVQLRTATGVVVDTLLFGTDNTDGWLDDAAPGGPTDGGAAVATSFAPKPVANRSLYRKENGVDTNQSGVDFVLAASPAQNTPGAANYTAPPIPDAGPTSSSSSSGSQGGSSGRPSSSSGGTGGSSSSGSSGSRSDGGRSSGGINPEGDDDEGDNSNLAADEGGCSTTAATPGTFLIGLAALFVMRRRRRA